MYGAIWRLLPGDRGTKVLVALGLVVVVVILLWYVVFPWLEPKIHFDHGTVGGPSVAPISPAHQGSPHK